MDLKEFTYSLAFISMDVLSFCKARQIKHQPLVIVLVKQQVLFLSKKYACIIMYVYLRAGREEH